MTLIFSRKLGEGDWIAECVVDGHYLSKDGKNPGEAFDNLEAHLKRANGRTDSKTSQVGV